MLDFLDPNTWSLAEPYEFRIYGDDNAQTWAVVDEVDYHFLIRWKWSWTTPNKTSNTGKKRYLRRNFEYQLESPYVASGTYINPETGYEVRARKPRVQQTLRLHTVIMIRTGIVPPTPKHELVDHLDGDETNCKRYNLRWSTHQMNAHNQYGRHAK
jgi:hypothetical protein